MTKILLICLSLAVFQFETAFAKPASAPTKKQINKSRFPLPRILSYAQLQALNPKARKAYAQQLASVIVTLEKMQKKALVTKGLVAENDGFLQQLKYMVSQISLMDSAFAQDPPAAVTTKVTTANTTGGVYLDVVHDDVGGQSYHMRCNPPMVVDTYIGVCALPGAVPATGCTPPYEQVTYNVTDSYVPNPFGGAPLVTFGGSPVSMCAHHDSVKNLKDSTYILGRPEDQLPQGGRPTFPKTAPITAFTSLEAAKAALSTNLNSTYLEEISKPTSIPEYVDPKSLSVSSSAISRKNDLYLLPVSIGASSKTAVPTVIKNPDGTFKFGCSDASATWMDVPGACAIQGECKQSGDFQTSYLDNKGAKSPLCIPRETFNGLSKERKELACDTLKGSDSREGDVDHIFTHPVTGPVLCSGGVSPDAQNHIPKADASGVKDVMGGSAANASKYDAKFFGTNTAPATPAAPAAPATPAADVQTAPANDTPADANKSTDIAVKADPAPSSADATPSCGGYPKVTCDVDAATAGKNFRDQASAYGNSCIYGGNFSSYRDGKPKAGNCSPVTDLSSDGYPAEMSCPSSPGITICNPILFGVNDDGSPICLHASKTATSDCMAQSVGKKYDVDSFGGADAYAGFVTKLQETFNRLCNGKGPGVPAGQENLFACYFNSECNNIGQKLAEAASRAGVNCDGVKASAPAGAVTGDTQPASADVVK